MKSTVIANANIALCKYWGKRDESLILPINSSISVTLSGTETTTTVEFSNKYSSHTIVINDQEFKLDEKNIPGHLDKILKLTGLKGYFAKVVSNSTLPIGAGLASSAAGFAALTYAATSALGLKLSEKELSILTRQGSGSACRSIQGGFVEWLEGKRIDGLDSYSKRIKNENFWPEFTIIATIISNNQKSIGSRVGMAQTVKTSPFYKAWIETVEKDFNYIREGILKKDIDLVGSVAEKNSIKMHSTMMTTNPMNLYWLPETITILKKVEQFRSEGIKVYFTMDAGPNVKIICLKEDSDYINKIIQKIPGVIDTIVCSPGPGIKLTNKHLF